MADIIEIIISVEGKAANAAATKTEKNIDKLGKTSKRVGGNVASLGKKMIGLAGSVVGPLALTAALATLGAGIKASIKLAQEQARVDAQLGAVLRSTGNAAGLSAKEIKDHASALQSTTNFGDEATIAGQNLLLTFTNIGSDVFPRATAAMLDVSTAMKQDIKSSAVQLGKALNDPIEGLATLSRVGIQFTDEQKKLIKSFSDAGETAKAQGIILDELEKQFGGSAAAARKADGNFIALDNTLGDLGENIGAKLIPSMAEFNELAITSIAGWSKATTQISIIDKAIGNLAGSQDSASQSTANAASKTVDLTRKLFALSLEGYGVLATKAAKVVFTEEEIVEAFTEATVAVKEQSSALEFLPTAMNNGAIAAEGLSLATDENKEAVNRWIGIAGINKQALDELAQGHTLTAREVEDYTESQRLAAEAEDAHRQAMDSLLSTLGSQAGFYNSLSSLRAGSLADEQEHNASLFSIRESAKAKTSEQAQKLSESLAGIETKRQERLHFILTGAHARSQEANDFELAASNAHYDQLRDAAVAKSKEKTDGIAAQQKRSESMASAARAAEKAELQSHLEELKLQTVLAMLETSGQLEQITGLVGVSAGEAADLITAGMIPVTQNLALAMQGTMAGLESDMASAASTATENQSLIQQAMAGTLTATDNLKLGTDATAAALDLALGEPLLGKINNAALGLETFNLGATLGTQTLLETAINPLQLQLDSISLVSLPSLQESYSAAMVMMQTGTGQLIAKLANLDSAVTGTKAGFQGMSKDTVAALKKIKEGTKSVAQTFKNQLAQALRIVIKLFNEMKASADAARNAARGAGSAASEQTGGSAKFSHGTPPGGITVPNRSEFRNDGFRARFDAGEQIFAFPKGQTPNFGNNSQQTTTNNFTLVQNFASGTPADTIGGFDRMVLQYAPT